MKKNQPLVVAIHGILTGQTNASWPDRLDAAWSDSVKVLKKEYRAGPLPLFNTYVENRRLAKALCSELVLFRDRELYFVSHSNGTDVALKTIKLLTGCGIKTAGAVFIGSVLDPDIQRSGIRELVDSGMLERAVAWSSEDDQVIRRAAGFSWYASRILSFGLLCGYGRLGSDGFQLAGQPTGFSARVLGGKITVPDFAFTTGVATRWWNGFGHSTYFEPDHLKTTFQWMANDLRLKVVAKR